MGERTTARPRGRPPTATQEQLLALATRRFLEGRRIDVQELAGELGLSRTTVYRWHGSREGLVGDVIAGLAEPLLAEAARGAQGEGAARLLDAFDRFNRALAAAPPLRHFLEAEREAAIRLLTDGTGRVQPRLVARVRELIEAEVALGYRAPVEPGTLAYAIVRLAEAFLYNDAANGLRGDVDRLRDVEAALLGVHGHRPPRPTERRG